MSRTPSLTLKVGPVKVQGAGSSHNPLRPPVWAESSQCMGFEGGEQQTTKKRKRDVVLGRGAHGMDAMSYSYTKCECIHVV